MGGVSNGMGGVNYSLGGVRLMLAIIVPVPALYKIISSKLNVGGASGCLGGVGGVKDLWAMFLRRVYTNNLRCSAVSSRNNFFDWK